MPEHRAGFGHGMITALIRVEGRPLANNPHHFGGTVDSDAADKSARFMQLCDAYDSPLLSLNDSPGNMDKPEAEKTGLIRHCCCSVHIRKSWPNGEFGGMGLKGQVKLGRPSDRRSGGTPRAVRADGGTAL